jgi:hypothetical protein
MANMTNLNRQDQSTRLPRTAKEEGKKRLT